MILVFKGGDYDYEQWESGAEDLRRMSSFRIRFESAREEERETSL